MKDWKVKNPKNRYFKEGKSNFLPEGIFNWKMPCNDAMLVKRSFH